ncbi:MAG TPA: glycoside hydrolase 43 family protein [Candidatus Ruania gallistercoris]|uniref:Glycoside hydrolase 43 family protein n=1 Tax=Candidatus Ruania gallistercoris TaxID=2838746 RepID=A0A9D2EET4_9MICO|nr:glycoside hydrolase 43 family protein [Candidatus Ruania gallistercoris]
MAHLPPPIRTPRPGRYRNPVLDEDWPDPDVIAFGDEYLMVASSFNRAPGLPVLRSADLVAWQIAGHALAAVPPADHFALPRHGGGVWAPSIRARDGVLYIVWPDPDHGLYVSTATDPAGPWTPPHLLLAGQGLIDPCPLWDTDGRTYLVHGWAGSRSGMKNLLTAYEVSPDLRSVIAPGRTIIDGAALPGYRTLEGPKWYRRDGWYWIFAPAGGVATGWQAAFRSRSVYGPYEGRTVLTQGDSPVNGPHQGAWVTDPGGADWFVHFQDRGAYGRVTHLQPMHWDGEGWPVLGEGGEPVLEHAAPVTSTRQEMRAVDGSDDFTGPLNPKWHWQANPDPDWYARTDRQLVLAAVGNDLGDLRQLPQVLSQQLPGLACTYRTSLTLDAGAGPARAGLVLLGQEYVWIGVEAGDGGTHLVCRRSGRDDSADQRRVEVTLITRPVPAGATVQLRLESDGAGRVRLAWATGAEDWHVVPQDFTPVAGHWIGAEVGLFAAAPPGTGNGPPARYGAFEMTSTESVRVEG